MATSTTKISAAMAGETKIKISVATVAIGACAAKSPSAKMAANSASTGKIGAFYRLTDRPFGFRPGLTYVYTDRCGRGQCMVLVFSPRSRTPIDRTWAPRLDRGFFFARGERDGRFDGRGDGRNGGYLR